MTNEPQRSDEFVRPESVRNEGYPSALQISLNSKSILRDVEGFFQEKHPDDILKIKRFGATQLPRPREVMIGTTKISWNMELIGEVLSSTTVISGDERGANYAVQIVRSNVVNTGKKILYSPSNVLTLYESLDDIDMDKRTAVTCEDTRTDGNPKIGYVLAFTKNVDQLNVSSSSLGIDFDTLDKRDKWINRILISVDGVNYMVMQSQFLDLTNHIKNTLTANGIYHSMDRRNQRL